MLAKLLINVVASVVLLLYMQALSFLADVAVRTPAPSGDLGVLRSPSAVLHASAALLLLLVAACLSVYKPHAVRVVQAAGAARPAAALLIRELPPSPLTGGARAGRRALNCFARARSPRTPGQRGRAKPASLTLGRGRAHDH